MVLTPHILSGAALGANVQNPWIVAGLSIVLHFLFDMLPHGDYLNKKSRLGEFWKVAVDLTLGLALVFWIVNFRGIADENMLENIALGIFFSLLPDGTTFLYIWMKMKFLHPIKKFHERLHYHPEFSPKRQFRLRNNLWDILISFASLFILLLI